MGLKVLPKHSGEYLLEVVMRRYERASTLMTSNRPVEDWGKLLGDSAAVTAMLDRMLQLAPSENPSEVLAGLLRQVHVQRRPVAVRPRRDGAELVVVPPAAPVVQLLEVAFDAIAAGQRDDGGWMFDWLAWNEAVAWAWRGRITVDALRILQANGRL